MGRRRRSMSRFGVTLSWLGMLVLAPWAASAQSHPDLIVNSVSSPPTSALPGQSFSVTAIVKNQGGAAAPASTTKFFLVNATTKKNLKGVEDVDALPVGASGGSAVTVAIYSDTVPGTYSLQACADGLKVIVETVESNNCTTAAGTIQVRETPDLIVSAIGDPPSTAFQGQPITVTSTIKNVGAETAGPSNTRYYLVPISGLGKKDMKGTPSVPSLDPGHTFTEHDTVTVRHETVPGDYLLQACADSGKVIVEHNENNNCLTSGGSIHITTPPDLVVTSASFAGSSPTTPLTVPLDGTIAITAVVKNQGVGTAAASALRIFLVAPTFTKDLKGHPATPSLAGGASATTKGNVVVFSDTAPGTYTIRACADYQDVVPEADESNNCAMAAGSVTVTP